MISFNHIKKANVSPSGRRHPDVCRGLNKAGRGAADMPFSDGLPFPIFGNMAEIPRRVVAVQIRTSGRLLRTYGQRPGASMVMPFSEDSQSCLNKVRPRTITKSGFQDVEHGKERLVSERDFFRRGVGERLRYASVCMCWTNTP